MMVLPTLDDKEIDAIKLGLPSYNILKFVTTGVIRHPKTSDLIILKWRMPWPETEKLTENYFVELNDRRTWDADWSDLIGKNIIISPTILHTDARKVYNRMK
ncbi:hypothetical protein SAMN04487895_101575 [Paenibacillus sophorae]|uniref:Uncharacterized protein n=1 Tax=Paenibacillus sophorae TaxID=1333845 RepID=A0A1H8GNB5_9BACL|nr:hypothetical protein [Paenibacillus sophorae]QWU14278.1 hypothetical protein KP014_20440 [Paenibacillus sophorae]SEN45234.1 hypothetical protein SAMN04487895_101575 [Paenibacillus sophorae]